MPIERRIRSVLIRPQDFGSSKAVAHVAGVEEQGFRFRLIDLPLVCVLLDNTGKPLWRPSIFLAECALNSRGVTGDTARTYGEALVNWLDFLSSIGEGLEDASEESLQTYRAKLAHETGQSGEPYATSTVNNRVTVCVQFHIWGQKSESMRSPLGKRLVEWERSRGERNRFLHTFSPSKRRPVAPRVIRRLPVALSLDEVSRLLSVAPAPYNLMFKWCASTGLRRLEVCNLRVSTLDGATSAAFGQRELVTFSLIRKGGRDVTIYAPDKLLEDTRWYIRAERRKPREGFEDLVFINARGAGVSRSSLSLAFRRCADRIGSKATLHHLRHTFAVHVLQILERKEVPDDPMNSLKTLQVLLGHASIESTEMYLQAADTSSALVAEALDFLYGGAL